MNNDFGYYYGKPIEKNIKYENLIPSLYKPLKGPIPRKPTPSFNNKKFIIKDVSKIIYNYIIEFLQSCYRK